MKKRKSYIVKISIKKLQEVADYYQFPVAVFLGPLGTLTGKRREVLIKKAMAFDKLHEIFEEAREKL